MEEWQDGLRLGHFPANFDFSGCPIHCQGEVLDVNALLRYDGDYWRIDLNDDPKVSVPPTLSIGKLCDCHN